MIKLGEYIQKNSKLILKNPCNLTWYSPWRGLCRPPAAAFLCTEPSWPPPPQARGPLTAQEKNTWNSGENSESAPTVTLTEKAGRMRFETELGGVCVRLQVQTCTFALTQNQQETSGRSFSLNYEARPGFLSVIWLHWSWHRQWPIRVSEALMLVRHQTTYLTWPGNTWGREKRLLTLLYYQTQRSDWSAGGDLLCQT